MGQVLIPLTGVVLLKLSLSSLWGGDRGFAAHCGSRLHGSLWGPLGARFRLSGVMFPALCFYALGAFPPSLHGTLPSRASTNEITTGVAHVPEVAPPRDEMTRLDVRLGGMCVTLKKTTNVEYI